MRHVSLHLCTTTFKKEDYILPNIQLLKETVLAGNDSLAENLWIHVVDNGRTLPAEEIETEHVMVHPNLNVGGAGGCWKRWIIRKNRPMFFLWMMML